MQQLRETYYWKQVFVQEGGLQLAGWLGLNLQVRESHWICKKEKGSGVERRGELDECGVRGGEFGILAVGRAVGDG